MGMRVYFTFSRSLGDRKREGDPRAYREKRSFSEVCSRDLKMLILHMVLVPSTFIRLGSERVTRPWEIRKRTTYVSSRSPTRGRHSVLNTSSHFIQYTFKHLIKMKWNGLVVYFLLYWDCSFTAPIGGCDLQNLTIQILLLIKGKLNWSFLFQW